MLTVRTTHFGHLTHYSELFVNPQDLKRLGEHLIASAEKLSENELAPTVAEGPVSREQEREEGPKSQKGFVELFVQDDGTLKSQP